MDTDGGVMTKSKLQKEYIRQLAKQINNYSGCKFDEKLVRECMLVAAYLAIEKMNDDPKKKRNRVKK